MMACRNFRRLMFRGVRHNQRFHWTQPRVLFRGTVLATALYAAGLALALA